MLQTYQTKLSNIFLNTEWTTDMYLEEYGKFFGTLERKLFVQTHIQGIPSSSLKKTFSKRYGITARQFNSIRMQLDGKVSSIFEKRKLEIQELKAKTAYLQNIIGKKTSQKELLHKKLLQISQTSTIFLKQRKNYQNLKLYLHQKKRRLRNLLQKLDKLKFMEEVRKWAVNVLGNLKESSPRSIELIKTLYAFLLTGGSLERTANDLSLSVGGLRYRISKIEELLQKDIRDPITGYQLLLTIQALNLIGDLDLKSQAL